MNIFQRLFKRPKPFIQEDWSNAKEVMNQRMKKEGEFVGLTIYSTPLGLVKGLPILTKQEVMVLKIIFTAYPFRIDRPSLNRMYRKDPSRHLLNLIKKGYIKRPQKGWYTLTFAKYD